MRFLLVLTTLLAFTQPASALVMCGQKGRDGTVASGASVKLRDACRSTEIQIDPVALGLQGPQGEPGAAGPAGPGMIARDANGVILGPFFPADADTADAGVVIFKIGDKTMRVHVNTDGTFNTGHFEPHYASNDCSGTSLMSVGGAGWSQSLFPRFLPTVDGQGIIVPGPSVMVQAKSRFTYPEGVCEQVNAVAPTLYAPLVTVPIATPLIIETRP